MASKQKHPKALPYLFLTEMWERFGFYVVQGMLVLFMTKSYGFSDDKSYTILGVFSALAYIAPMIGGLIADRLLGFKQAIIWGGVFLCSGYAFLAVSGPHNFYFALATIIVGNGLFKPNISSLLGTLYAPGDTARDAGFTIFYVGINLGALLAGVSSGFIKDHFGWHTGFALASVGLLIGLFTFMLGVKWGGIQLHVALKKHRFLTTPWLMIYCLAAIPLIGMTLRSSFIGKWLLPVVGIFLLFFVFFLAYKQNPRDRNRLITLNILIIASIIFWMIWMQIFFSANLFIDRLVNKEVFGFHVPTTVFYALESVFVILLGPIFAGVWQSLSEHDKSSSPFLKFVFAIFFAGLGFLTLAFSTFYPDSQHLVNPLWIVLSYFLITTGELLLSPIGLSAVTMLSPPHLTGMMMGIWFVALGFGGAFAGWLAKFSSIPESAKDAISQLPIYRAAFFHYALLAFAVAIVLFIIQILVKKKLQEFE